MNKIFVVARYVFLKNLKSPAYYWMLVAPFVFILISLAIGFFAAQSIQNSPDPKIAVAGSQQQVNILKSALRKQARIVSEKNQQAARRDFNKEKVDAVLTVNNDFSNAHIRVNSGSNTNLEVNSIQAVLSSIKIQSDIARFGLNAQQASRLSQPARLASDYVSVDNASGSGRKSNPAIGQAVSIFSILAVFIFLISYVQITGSEVGSEKGSHVLDSILAAVPAKDHFKGKVLAIIGLFVVQLIFYLVLVLLALGLAGPLGYQRFLNQIDFSIFDPLMIFITVMILFASIILFIILAAIFASTVSRQEDVPKSTSIVVWLAMIPYFVSFSALSSPNSPFFRVLSYVPFFSQSLMPIRLSLNSASYWEGGLAFLIQVVVIAVLMRFAGDIYAANALNYDDEKPLKKLLSYFKLRKS
ncbi:ABC transporter permease [Oenococcus alcoholitolerans]|uniref:ABC transporter permease n=1 Tax=Oenococcus alcoholitolerans TaxID=931074 RepID=UPI003F707AF0